MWLGLGASGVTDGTPPHVLEVVWGTMSWQYDFLDKILREASFVGGTCPAKAIDRTKIADGERFQTEVDIQPPPREKGYGRESKKIIQVLMALDDDPEDFVLHRFLSSIQFLGS